MNAIYVDRAFVSRVLWIVYTYKYVSVTDISSNYALPPSNGLQTSGHMLERNRIFPAMFLSF